jgi:hypothetical protein
MEKGQAPDVAFEAGKKALKRSLVLSKRAKMAVNDTVEFMMWRGNGLRS